MSEACHHRAANGEPTIARAHRQRPKFHRGQPPSLGHAGSAMRHRDECYSRGGSPNDRRRDPTFPSGDTGRPYAANCPFVT